MKKNTIRWWVLLGVVLVVYNVLAFALPFPKTAVFAVSYLFSMIAILAQIYVIRTAFYRGEGVKSKFYGFPIAKVGVIYLAIQLIGGLVFMALGLAVPVWLPLVLPALPLADGQYRLALYAWLDGEWWTVLWGHLLWVVPWMLFILRPAWRQRDPRLTVVARTLGWGSTRIFWLLTLPSLTRPLLTALAVGFSVSIAQYLPTLWLGAGRIPTLTSQAVALSSGGEAQTLAAQALWQLLLPAVCFTLTALLAWLAGRYRRGLR